MSGWGFPFAIPSLLPEMVVRRKTPTARGQATGAYVRLRKDGRTNVMYENEGGAMKNPLRNFLCWFGFHIWEVDLADINECRWRFCRWCGLRQNNATRIWRNA